MKTAVLLMVLSVSMVTWARSEKSSDKTQVYSAVDPKLGELVLKVEDMGEPIQQPYAMSLTVKCVDNRAKPNSVKPKLENIDLGIVIEKDETSHDRICKFDAFNFDGEQKILEIKYSKTAMKVGPGECDTDFSRKFDLSKLCAAWNR